jgi:segregation and condensation protein A
MRIAEVRAYLESGQWAAFDGLLASAGTREELVLTFLALLEMVRTGRIRLVQTEAFGEIRVRVA